MANATLQGNVAAENARRRVTEELMPRQDYWRDQLGIPEPQLPTQPYTTFDVPIVSPEFMRDATDYGGGTASAPSAATSSSPATSNGTIGFAQAMMDAVSNNPALGIAPLGLVALTGIALSTMDSPDNSTAVDASAEGSADASVGVGPGPGDPSATDSSSVGAVNGADAASDAAAAATGDDGSASGDGGGGGGGGGKIVCTAMNQAYGFGSFRQAIWLEYSAKQLTKQHERGYHRIFRPLVKYAFHSGNGYIKQTVRRFLEWIMRLRTADLRAEMRGKNPHPVRRVIRRACEHICYMVGKS